MAMQVGKLIVGADVAKACMVRLEGVVGLNARI